MTFDEITVDVERVKYLRETYELSLYDAKRKALKEKLFMAIENLDLHDPWPLQRILRTIVRNM